MCSHKISLDPCIAGEMTFDPGHPILISPFSCKKIATPTPTTTPPPLLPPPIYNKQQKKNNQITIINNEIG